MTNDVQSLLHAGDSFAAVEQIQRRGTPLSIAAAYKTLVSDLYWKEHDLPSVIIIGRAGIMFCLGQSLSPQAAPELIESLRSTAKGLAYDVGSFTWPAWEEPGIEITPEALGVGRDCARLNLRLAVELNKPADRIAMAHWLNGAHALAAADGANAADQFEFALAALGAGDDPAKPFDLYRGFIAVAHLCENPSDLQTQAVFEDTLARLKARDDRDAKSYVAQLTASRRLFVREMTAALNRSHLAKSRRPQW